MGNCRLLRKVQLVEDGGAEDSCYYSLNILPFKKNGEWNKHYCRKYTMKWFVTSWILIPACWTFLKTRRATSECLAYLQWEHPIWAGYSDARWNASRKLQIMQILQEGNMRRTQEATEANKTSSRSHALLQAKAKRIRYQYFRYFWWGKTKYIQNFS